MSRMSEINLEIQTLLEEDMYPPKIAKILNVPLSWVYDTLEMMESVEPSYDPYDTVNS